jgi:hypothetical protein
MHPIKGSLGFASTCTWNKITSYQVHSKSLTTIVDLQALGSQIMDGGDNQAPTSASQHDNVGMHSSANQRVAQTPPLTNCFPNTADGRHSGAGPMRAVGDNTVCTQHNAHVKDKEDLPRGSRMGEVDGVEQVSAPKHQQSLPVAMQRANNTLLDNEEDTGRQKVQLSRFATCSGQPPLTLKQ